MVGRYRIGGRLGSGGMGEVFWGRSPSGRPVAVKVVHRHLATQPQFRARFVREVEAAGRVSGFHTASVVDADPDGDPPYLVTAYVEGPSLAEAIRRNGPFAVPALRALGAGLAEALDAVNAAGLVHRDLKPANVILLADGPRVIDFGIARAVDGDGLTGTGLAIGTPQYMAPEQFGSATITGAADVWALGGVLCAAAGIHPFGEGSPGEIMGAVVLRAPALDRLPAALVPIVARCLDKDPARRPTPRELLDELSDGTASRGWLPPAVAVMLAERALPDEAVPDRTGTDQTGPAGELRPTTPVQSPPGPRPTRQLAHPPVPTRTSTPPRSRSRLRRIGLGVALLVGTLVFALAASAYWTHVLRTTAPTAFQGSWSSDDGQGDAGMDIHTNPPAYSTYWMFISVHRLPQCGDQPAAGTRDASVLPTQQLSVVWQLTCDGSGQVVASGTVVYTYDADHDRVTDSTGRRYTRNT